MGREKNAENIPFLRSTQPKSTERVPVVELSGYLDEPETLAPEKWFSEPVILSLPEAVQEVLRAVSRIPFSETAAAGDLGFSPVAVMDAVALNPLFPLIPTYRIEDVALEAGPRHNDGLWICGDLRELEKSPPVRWWY